MGIVFLSGGKTSSTSSLKSTICWIAFFFLLRSMFQIAMHFQVHLGWIDNNLAKILLPLLVGTLLSSIFLSLYFDQFAPFYALFFDTLLLFFLVKDNHHLFF
eukprot:c28311_g1_i1.p2 GENE.c28311_g1_i1~~c28311_g1_i1.p2  ORF type:complete len:102 (+),score=13.50 c28311_g1_i1:125-430(+)